MNFKQIAHLLTTIMLGAACSNGGGGPEVLTDLPILTPPPGGMAVFTPIIKNIPAGADVTYCTFTNVILDQPLLLHNTKGRQSNLGHHIILFSNPTPQPAKTVSCDSADMESFRQVIGGGGGEGTTVWAPPARVAALIPAGSQLVIQTHWINTTDRPHDAQGMIITEPATMMPDTIIAGSLAVVATSFRIPANQRFTASTECELKQDKSFLMVIGHEHEWGTHVTLEHLPAGGTPVTLWDSAFNRDFTFNPPVNEYPLDAPLLVKMGDRLRVTCEWQNSTASPIEFPQEMCVLFGYTSDGETIQCVDGQWGG